jgi:hypothetical protein
MKKALLNLAVGCLLCILPASQAFATKPSHTKIIDNTFDYINPAGAPCTFPVHDYVVANNNIIEWTAPDGTVLFTRIVINATVIHENVTTGFRLSEDAHYINNLDWVNGTWTVNGNGWHIVDADGKILLVSGGRYSIDLNTGEILESTPNSHPNYGDMCPLLAGPGAR